MSQDFLSLMLSMDDTPIIREHTTRRAPFGYPGGKGDSAKHIHPHLPYRSGYAEPFGGSGVILLQRQPVDLEIFNDRFSGVTSFYRVIRDAIKLQALLDRVELCQHSREEFEWCRDTWDKCEDDVERAARWWYMHQCSFGKQGRHFGRSISGKAQTGHALKSVPAFFRPTHQRLKGVTIENLDWYLLMKDYDNKEMVWYLDPPYVKYSKGMYKHEFSKKDHYALCEWIFTRTKGFVALSGYGDPETKEIYDRYNWDRIEEWDTVCVAAGFAFSDTNNLAGTEGTFERGKVRENLWIKEAEL